MSHYRATKQDQIIVRVYRDEQDPQNRGWAYQMYDGSPDMPRSDWAFVESGPIAGRQTSVAPSRARILRSASVKGGRHVHVIIVD